MLLESLPLRSAGFPHGFSTRDVPAERERWAPTLGLSADRVHQARQVHGARVVQPGRSPDETWQEEADALVTVEAGVAVAVRVADCVPVLVGDPIAGRAAAIHAGWRGVVANVIGETLLALAREAPASRPEELVVAVGPCIGPCCFEVSQEVASAIARASSPSVVTRTLGEKAFVDLRLAVRHQLRSSGIANSHIEDVAGCTRCEPDRFFSYRRAQAETRSGDAPSAPSVTGGRQIAAIAAIAKRAATAPV